MVAIFMMSAKLATLGLFKIKLYRNKGYETQSLSMMMSLTKFYHVSQRIL